MNEPDSREAIDHPQSECVPCGPGCAGHWVVPDDDADVHGHPYDVAGHLPGDQPQGGA